MAIRTPLTELSDLTYPIVLAPMGFVSGGELAAAVSNAGGLGVVGGGYGEPEWLARELAIVTTQTRRAWGVGLITWSATTESVELALSHRPNVFFFAFGDPRRFIARIKEAGCLLVCQAEDVEAALEVQEMGADIVIAQGAEAGGHGATRATLPLVPVVVDAVAPTPVLAAGGIGDGRGVAAALALGAAGAVVGTRFCVAEEALVHPTAKQRLVSARGIDTRRTHVFDTARGRPWPTLHTGRALHNRFLAEWHDRDTALAEDAAELERYREAAETGDFDTALIWAGEAVDMANSIEPASAIVERIGRDAEAWLRQAQKMVT